MKSVLIDTNVILDLLSKREPYYLEGRKIFSLADLKEVNLIISSLSLCECSLYIERSFEDKRCKIYSEQIQGAC